MKFLCLECDDVMDFAERQLPGDGTFAAVFSCGSCGREIAMLANPMETQLVSSMGVQIGGRELPEQPMELTRTRLADGREDAFEDPEIVADPAAEAEREDTGAEEEPPPDPEAEAEPGAASPRETASPPSGGPPGAGSNRPSVEWSPEAVDRLQKVPRFVRGMVKRIYTDYAQEQGIERMTPATMDRARSDLGLEGM